MHIAVRQITLRLAENHSLKGKRRVLVGLKARVRQRYNVSITQLDKSNLWQLATLGLASVSPNANQAQNIVEEVTDFIVGHVRGDADVIDVETEVMSSIF